MLRNEQEIRSRLKELQDKETDMVTNPTWLTNWKNNRIILRSQIKGLLYALGEDEGFNVVVSWK